MNHDYAHCADFKDDCPKKCFRAKLVRDLQKYGKLAPYGINYTISWMHFKGTDECKKKGDRKGLTWLNIMLDVGLQEYLPGR